MKNLAQIAFDHIWMLLFEDDGVVDPDYCVSRTEEIALQLADFSDLERDALAEVASDAKARLLADPDEYGYTPRDLVTNEQREFLDAAIAKAIYDNDWWTA